MSTKDFFNLKAIEAGYLDEDKGEHFTYWLDCSLFESQTSILLEWIKEYASKHATSFVTTERMTFIRNQAISVQELTKGFTTTPKDNAMLSLLEFTDYILELTSSTTLK